MARFQGADKDELKQMMEERNLWLSLQSQNLVAVEQARSPARIIAGGLSLIVSYYDKEEQYVCTLHHIVSSSGEVVHEHLKDALIDGVRYLAR